MLYIKTGNSPFWQPWSKIDNKSGKQYNALSNLNIISEVSKCLIFNLIFSPFLRVHHLREVWMFHAGICHEEIHNKTHKRAATNAPDRNGEKKIRSASVCLPVCLLIQHPVSISTYLCLLIFTSSSLGTAFCFWLSFGYFLLSFSFYFYLSFQLLLVYTLFVDILSPWLHYSFNLWIALYVVHYLLPFCIKCPFQHCTCFLFPSTYVGSYIDI